MPRNKVPPALRRRVARACDSCKKRKAKCNGSTPCNQCASRHQQFHCRYAEVSPGAGAGSGGRGTGRASHSPARPLLREVGASSSSRGVIEAHQALDALEHHIVTSRSGGRSDSPPPNSAPLMQNSRILRDNNGKFIYVGESAALSFLQIVRKAYGAEIGPCEFTTDQSRHRMIETGPKTRFALAQRPVLDLGVCNLLVGQYSLVASGLLDLFDPTWLQDLLPSWLLDEGRDQRSDSALVYLVLAIGAQSSVRVDDGDDLAEACFGYGRQLAVYTLMDNPSLPTVQAFTLIAYYMISACRRNAAFSNLGVAVRAAYALGIHRHETNVFFVPEEGISRERAWKTLRVCDLFLSASMGRPPATSDSDCNIPWTFSEPRTGGEDSVSSQVSSAIFRICHVFDRVLVEVYTRRSVSLELAGSIAGQLKEWTEKLPHMLKIDGLDQGQPHECPAPSHRLGSSIVTLAYYWSVILLTRPFLAFKTGPNKKISRAAGGSTSETGLHVYADACVDSALRTIDIAYDITFDEFMPHRQPFVVNNVFCSALCLGLAYLDNYDRRGWRLGTALNRSVSILQHFGRHDPLSSHYSQICQLLKSTAEVHVDKRDRYLVQSRGSFVRSTFGNIQQRSSFDPEAATTPSSGYSSAGTGKSQHQIDAVQRLQASPTIMQSRSDMWEPLSPASYQDQTLLHESLITTSGHLDLGDDFAFGAGAYNVMNDTSRDMLPSDISDIGHILNSYPSSDTMPLFSLTTGLSTGEQGYPWQEDL